MSVISSNYLFFVLLNWLFFGSVIIGTFWTEMSPSLAHPPLVERSGNLLLMVVEIFVSNLGLSAFIMLTLSGFVFFLLSPILLLIRAWLWGLCLLEFQRPIFLWFYPL